MRRLLGVTWDHLPALAFNTLEQQVIPYRGSSFDRDTLRVWIRDVGSGRIEPDATTFSHAGIRDTEFHSTWLGHCTEMSRPMFVSECLGGDQHCVVFFYTTEVISI